MNAKNPIGVFDSGIGGLTVVKALREVLPYEDFIYLGDTARVPYGNKTADTVTRFSHEVCRFLISHNVKMIVVACNTASALSLPLLEKDFPIPILGMISSGADAALQDSTAKHIGIIGTSATIESGAYTAAIRAKAPFVRVSSKACPLLVPLVEEGWLEHKITLEILREYLDPMLQDNIDSLVLGCTHYPLLKSLISQVVNEKVRLVDSAEASAKATVSLLEKFHLSNPDHTPGRTALFVTDLPRKIDHVVESFLGIQAIETLKVCL
ncbi:MAG: glutamate racemase [Verrucomicrobiota bacterium]|nr:glutamate racemase [Verrucomicrobiota bacterium]